MIKIINTVHIKQNFGPFYEPDPLIIDPGKNLKNFVQYFFFIVFSPKIFDLQTFN